MKGHLAYSFLPENGGTRLIQQETLEPQGLLRLFAPWIERSLSRQLHHRLEGIKQVLEAGWVVAGAS